MPECNFFYFFLNNFCQFLHGELIISDLRYQQAKINLKTCDIPCQCYSNTELLTEAQRETKLNGPQSWIAVLGTFLPPPADSERRRPRSRDMKVLT